MAPRAKDTADERFASLVNRKGGKQEAAPGEASYTLAEVAKHATADDCWLIIHGKVYDVTKWCAGGPSSDRRRWTNLYS